MVLRKFSASQVYAIMEFISSFANSTMFTTYAVYYIATLGLDPLQLLIIGTVLEGTVLIFEGITGVIADTYGRKRSVTIGMFIVAAGFMLQGAVPWLEAAVPIVSAFVLLLISQLFWGIGHTFMSGADAAWIVDEVGEEKVGRLFLKTKRYALIGTLLGIALSVGLSAIAPNAPFLIGGLMLLGLGVFLIFFMKETKFERPERDAETSHWRNMKATWLSGAKVVRRQPLLLLILAVTIFSGAASEGYDRLKEAHLITEIGFPAEVGFSMSVWFGLIAVVTTLLGLVAVRIAEKRMDMSNDRAVMIGMFALTGLRIAALLLFAFSPNFAVAIAALLAYDVIRTLSGPIYDTWLNLNIESKSRATVLSMMSQSDALGQTAGGPFVGWIGSRWSVRASLVAAAVLLTPILGAFGRALARKK